MTSRERLLCVLSGGTPDRVPISPFVQEDFLSYFFNKSKTDRLVDGLACAKTLHFDFIAKEIGYGKPHFIQKSYPNWTLDCSTRIVKSNCYRTTTITTPCRVLKKVEVAPYYENLMAGISFSTCEYLIKDEADFDAFVRYLPQMDSEDIRYILDGAMFANRTIGQHGISSPWCTGGVYNLVSSFIDVQDMMIDSLENPDYYQAYMTKFAEIIARSNHVFAESCFDSVGVGGNIANGAMVGEVLFDEYILPYERLALQPLIDAGTPTFYHNCGYARHLHPCYKRLGFTCWETIAEPSRGDNHLADAKAYFGDSLVLCGTFDQVEYLKTAAPRGIYCKAAETVLTGKPNAHYIFAASDFLECDTPIENVTAMFDGARSTASY